MPRVLEPSRRSPPLPPPTQARPPAASSSLAPSRRVGVSAQEQRGPGCSCRLRQRPAATGARSTPRPLKQISAAVDTRRRPKRGSLIRGRLLATNSRSLGTRSGSERRTWLTLPGARIGARSSGRGERPAGVSRRSRCSGCSRIDGPHRTRSRPAPRSRRLGHRHYPLPTPRDLAVDRPRGLEAREPPQASTTLGRGSAASPPFTMRASHPRLRDLKPRSRHLTSTGPSRMSHSTNQS